MKYRRLAAIVTLFWLLLAAVGPRFAPYSYRAQDRDCVLHPPCRDCGTSDAGRQAHWLGTDDLGRDVLSRLLYAIRISLALALAMAGGALAIAVPVGLWSAASRTVDVPGRIAGEVVRGLPWIFVLLALRSALPLNAAPLTLVLLLVGVFAAAAWAVPAWIFRGAARALMQREFVAAAQALGASRRYLLRRHLWPNLQPLVLTYFAFLFIAAALAEVSLAMVGLGIPEPLPSLGNMLAVLRNPALAQHDWWLLTPLAVLVPLLTCLNLYAFSESRRPSG